MSSAATITGAQRDALYQVLITQLSTFDDLRMAYERAEADTRTSSVLGRVVSDALRLIVDGGVGWGDSSEAERVILTLPAGELRPILARVRGAAVSLLEALRPEYEEKLAQLDEVERARDACSELLARLGENGQSPSG